MFGFLNVNPDVEIDYSQKFNPSFVPKNKVIGTLNSQKRIKDWLKGVLPKSIKSKFKKTLYTNKNLPKLKEEERRFLAEIFKEDVMKLGKLINRDLSVWVAVDQ
jgi:hypothetical protein